MTSQGARPIPVVLVADAEIGGHFQKYSTLGDLLAGVVETNPVTLDAARLHDAAYDVMQPRLEPSSQASQRGCCSSIDWALVGMKCVSSLERVLQRA